MNLWYCKNLGDPMLAFEGLKKVEAAFHSAYGNDGCPADVAVLLRHESGRLHCEAKLYFSPASALIAETLGAEVCERPSKSGLSLLVGHPDALSVLFPENGCKPIDE